MNEDLLLTNEAAAYLRVSRTTLFVLARRMGLRRVRLGRAVRWRKAELDRLVDRCERK